MHRPFDLFQVKSRGQRLPCIPARQPEHLFKQLLVSLLAFGPHTEIMLNRPPDDSLIEEVGHPFPWLIYSHLRHGLGTPFRESLKSGPANLSMHFPVSPKLLPESLFLQRRQPVRG
jgi:hypothetical protein